MSDNFFLDTNIVIYALDLKSPKNQAATYLLQYHPTLSTQVIMESVNVLIKKFGFSRFSAFENAKFLIYNSKVMSVTEETILRAADIVARYEFSHWDSLIIASALNANCNTIYSEDFHDGQLIEGSLRIINPFTADIKL